MVSYNHRITIIVKDCAAINQVLKLKNFGIITRIVERMCSSQSSAETEEFYYPVDVEYVEMWKGTGVK